jgi:hypothetical protein
VRKDGVQHRLGDLSLVQDHASECKSQLLSNRDNRHHAVKICVCTSHIEFKSTDFVKGNNTKKRIKSGSKVEKGKIDRRKLGILNIRC